MATMTQYQTRDLRHAAQARGIDLNFDDANTLRRAERTLHGWAEQECGDSNDWRSWAIERDEETEKPFRVSHVHSTGKISHYAIPDRERGAMRRVSALCARLGIYHYHQTDPRGCALYISAEPIDQSTYDRGVSCSR
jgi:hypothetical protein